MIALPHLAAPAAPALSTALMLVLAGSLTACGQKGPLRLPEGMPASGPASAAPASAAPAGSGTAPRPVDPNPPPPVPRASTLVDT